MSTRSKMFHLEVVVVVPKRILNGLGHLKPAHEKDKLGINTTLQHNIKTHVR